MSGWGGGRFQIDLGENNSVKDKQTGTNGKFFFFCQFSS